MTDDQGREPVVDDPDDGRTEAYDPPTIQRLGTLAELTQGISAGVFWDGVGFASMPS